MEAFFKKFPIANQEKVAMEMIHDAIECAKHELHTNKKGNEYLRYLARAGNMITAFFEEKGIDPKTIV